MPKAVFAAFALSLFALTGASAQEASPFQATCAACHAQDAAGIPGFAPPLRDAELWARLGERAPEYLAGVMMSGLSGQLEAAGQTYLGAMPAQSQLSDEDMLAIAHYVLGEVNGLEVQLTAKTLAVLRASPPSHEALLSLRAGEN